MYMHCIISRNTILKYLVTLSRVFLVLAIFSFEDLAFSILAILALSVSS